LALLCFQQSSLIGLTKTKYKIFQKFLVTIQILLLIKKKQKKRKTNKIYKFKIKNHIALKINMFETVGGERLTKESEFQ